MRLLSRSVVIFPVIALIIFGYSFSLGDIANTQSISVLQEKCAEGGKKFFFERIRLYGGRWGSFRDEKGHGYNDFTAHYNEELDKCFIRIEYSYFPKDDKTIKAVEIYDVFEGKRFAGCSLRILSPPDCKVGEKTCNSLSEFETLIKPYMGNKEEVRGADWKHYATVDLGTLYYDSESLTRPSRGIVRVWEQTLYTQVGVKIAASKLGERYRSLSHTTRLLEIHCVERKFRFLQVFHYSSDGSVLSKVAQPTEWVFIVPESMSEQLYKAVCK